MSSHTCGFAVGLTANAPSQPASRLQHMAHRLSLCKCRNETNWIPHTHHHPRPTTPGSAPRETAALAPRAEEGARSEALSEALDAGYRHWRVEHAAGAWNVTANVKKSRATVSRDKAKGLIDGTKKTEATFAVGPQSHDRAKARLLTGEDPFLRFVGVATEDGKIKSSKRRKEAKIYSHLKCQRKLKMLKKI